MNDDTCTGSDTFVLVPGCHCLFKYAATMTQEEVNAAIHWARQAFSEGAGQYKPVVEHLRRLEELGLAFYNALLEDKEFLEFVANHSPPANTG
jgi:hypothetical protein